MNTDGWKTTLMGWLQLSPIVLILGFFLVLPIIAIVAVSFWEATAFSYHPAFIFENYQYLFTSSVTYSVYQLIGHPHLYDPDGGRLSVQERPAQLIVQKRGDEFHLSVEPAGHDHHYISVFDAANCLVKVTHFNAAQRRICDSLPAEGLVLPSDAFDRLQTLLKSLSGTMNVQGDAAVSAIDVRPGNPTPLLELVF
ncbi:hypothetical protein N9850_11360 [Granulosicoccus sp.]|nr:hypothetical protein [Granulosicoccus sp.]MDB4224363.1 hypothetical protein [Granulosicoccus sp.]